MSLYTVAAVDPTLKAEVGWELSLGSYWFYVTDARGERVASGGLDAYEEEEEVKRLVTLYDLVEASSGVVDWGLVDSGFWNAEVLGKIFDAHQPIVILRNRPAAWTGWLGHLLC
jgi:hypothetical protein